MNGGSSISISHYDKSDDDDEEEEDHDGSELVTMAMAVRFSQVLKQVLENTDVVLPLYQGSSFHLRIFEQFGFTPLVSGPISFRRELFLSHNLECMCATICKAQTCLVSFSDLGKPPIL